MIANRLVFRRITSWIAATGWRLSGEPEASREPAIVSDDFIFTRAPSAMSHASSIAASGDGLVAAWFAGSLESRPDVGITVARHDGHGWSTPVEVAHGAQEDGTRHACWNPVLFQPASGPLLLFYKVGRNPRSWWGMSMASSDGGRSWSAPRRLPEGILGPVKNKPVQLASGVVLSPSSAEHDGWRIHLERSAGHHGPWERSAPLNDGRTVAAIQPSILTHADGSLQLLSRTKHGRIAEAWSYDGGDTWSDGSLPCPIPTPAPTR